MELRSLILGLVFSLGIFAVKSGAGLAFPLGREMGTVRRVALAGAYVGAYGLLFVVAWLLALYCVPVLHLEMLMNLAQGGMVVHFLLAGLLLLWGVALLRRPINPRGNGSRGWLLLALPCPVCFAVIFSSVAFLHQLFPADSWLFVWLFAGFAGVGLVTGLALARFGGRAPEQGLGRIMILAALYFLVTIVVVPQFGDLTQIYRVSRATVNAADHRLVGPAILGMSLFTLGFLSTFRRKP